ncbi:MAG: hypothetical protein AB7O52_14325 [Planctomycetota bacterium]
MRPALTLTILASALLTGAPVQGQASFVRGDCNADGTVNIGDPISLLSVLFSGGATPPCVDACDTNDDGNQDIADAIYGLSFLFAGGPVPATPFPACGLDPTLDALSCLAAPGCPPSEICSNGIDDDGDTFVDCSDFDCTGMPPCIPEVCNNGIDDDGDTFVDCSDFDCTGMPPCIPEICNNGIDDDGDTFVDCSDFDCTGMPPCIPEICNNGIDDDGDTFVDCNDFDCVGNPNCP